MNSAANAPPAVRGLLIVTGVIWLVLELRQGANTRSDARTADQGSRKVIRGATVLGVAGSIVAKSLIPGADIHNMVVAAWAGLCILWSGIGLRLWSFSTLGRYFTFTVQTSSDQPVITTGPYGVLRHPSYTGVLLAVLGIGLVVGNWLSLIVLTGAVTCGIVYRIRIEEAALLQDLGDPYRDYAATHKRLIPFIW